ncbi:hypothetical protein GOP47_0023767 [Adiantum capillus-veneris]|uniref:Peptidase A1 domain-containing protein n=1 Tax=Adiantum capillus-veneris TaxID=13818 RepID=A0A9D4U4I6_ADICA|nr:hypothetical protein GOP47_0023767 [Adiantum capillus-veneris]
MRTAHHDVEGRGPTSMWMHFLFVALSVSTITGIRANGDGVTLPVFHSSHLTHLVSIRGTVLFNEDISEGPDASPLSKWTANDMSIPSSTAGNMQFPVVTLDEALGEYFAVMEIGTPSQKAAVAIDTGSQLMWVQCDPCMQCGQQSPHYPMFKPAQSSSYGVLTCEDCRGDDSVATACTGASSNRTLLNQPNRCVYFVSYGDKSSSTGFISTETLSLAGMPQDKILFGCGLITTGLVSSLNASGLLGLDRGRLSLTSQLGIKVFSYCLPNRVKNVHASGYLTLGAMSAAARASSQIQYTPLLQNHASQFLSQFYYVNMTGISVDGKLLNIPTSTFQLLPSGEGGTIIDSGTSITRFVHVAYASLAHAFEMAMDPSFKRISLGDAAPDLCYQVPLWKQTGPRAPKVTLHLANHVDLHLEAHHVLAFMGSDTSFSYYCLAFMDSGTSPNAKNYFGNYQQQDFLIEYDIANSRIGFAPLECNQGVSRKPIYFSLMWLFVLIHSKYVLCH